MWFGPVRLGYLKPDQFLDHLTVIRNTDIKNKKINVFFTPQKLRRLSPLHPPAFLQRWLGGEILLGV